MNVAGPGGKTVGKIGVRVLPDTSAFGRSLERYLRRVEHEFKVNIKVDLDVSTLANDARKAAQKIGNGRIKIPAEPDLDTTGFRAKIKAFQATVGDIKLKVNLDATDWASKLAFLKISSVAALAATAAISFPGLVQGAGFLAQTAAGLAALVPAAIAAAGAVGVTLVLGFKNFGKTLKAMGNPAVFAEQLKKLAPSAAATAIEIRKLSGAFKSIQLGVQQNLFQDMAGVLKQVATAQLPVISSGLRGVATSLNEVAKELGFLFSGSFTTDTLSKLFTNTQVAVHNAAPGVLLFTSAIFDLVRVGSTFLPRLGAAFSDIAGRVKVFISAAAKSGQLEAFISGAITGFTNLMHLVGNLGSIFGSLFKAASSSGADFFGVLGSVVAKVAEFLKSSQGQQTLVAVFKVLAVVGKLAGDIILTALKQLGPIIEKLTPSLLSIAQTLGGALVQAIQILGPVIIALAPAFDALAAVLRFLQPVLGPLAVGIIAISVASSILNGVLALLALNPVVLLFIGIVAAIVLVAAGIVALVKNFGKVTKFFSGVLTAIVTPFIAVAVFLQGIWNAIVIAVTTAWNSILTFFTTIFAAIGSVIITVATAIAQFLAGIWNAIVESTRFIWEPIVIIIGDILNILFNIIKIIVLGIAILLIAAWNGIVVAATAAWNVVKTVIITPIVAAADFIGGVFRGIFDFLSSIWRTITSAASSAWNAISNAISGPIRAVVGIVGDAVNSVVRVAGDAWNQVKGGVSGAWNDVISFFGTVGGKIVGALGDMGSLLFQAGKNIISGLLNGIKNVFEDVKNFVSGIGNWISDHKGPLPKDLRLLVPAGNAIMDGLLKGLIEGKRDVVAFLDGFTTDISAIGSVAISADGTPGGATNAPVINVFPQAGQSEEAIAESVRRKFAFAGRLG